MGNNHFLISVSQTHPDQMELLLTRLSKKDGSALVSVVNGAENHSFQETQKVLNQLSFVLNHQVVLKILTVSDVERTNKFHDVQEHAQLTRQPIQLITASVISSIFLVNLVLNSHQVAVDSVQKLIIWKFDVLMVPSDLKKLSIKMLMNIVQTQLNLIQVSMNHLYHMMKQLLLIGLNVLLNVAVKVNQPVIDHGPRRISDENGMKL